VGKLRKFYTRLMSGKADADISFSDLCLLLNKLEFSERIRGDHHIFTREGIVEIINLQPKGALAKPYQVKQVRSLLIKYAVQMKEGE
jgi:hypothetical protein